MTHNTTNDPTNKIPYGYCHCGCGQKTTLAPFDDKKHGYLKGQPRRYVLGHSRRARGPSPNPSGLCMCGCGQTTRIAPQTQHSKGWIAGEHVRYVAGHNVAPHRKSLTDAFWAYCTPGQPDKCWEWQGPKWRGYGYFKFRGQRFFAHRASYELHNQAIPDGMFVCHTCDNPPCVNPSHLWLGTHADNMADMNEKGRHGDASGERSGTSKLSRENVLEMRYLYDKQGIGIARLAERFGVTITNASYVVHRKTWKHLP